MIRAAVAGQVSEASGCFSASLVWDMVSKQNGPIGSDMIFEDEHGEAVCGW